MKIGINIAADLLALGVKTRFINPEFINYPALERKTSEIVSHYSSITESQMYDLASDLITVWFPAVMTLHNENGDDWSNYKEVDLDVNKIIQTHIYVIGRDNDFSDDSSEDEEEDDDSEEEEDSESEESEKEADSDDE